MKPFIAALIAAILLLTTIAVGGCGKKKEPVVADSAEATAKGFADAISAADLDRAATAFDYVSYARANNESWDDIPPGQQQQIIKKITEDKAGELKAYQTRLGTNVKAGPSQDGTVALTGDAGTVNILLKAREGKYYVVNIW